jgi:class 3 adenylate cyclase
VVFRAFGFVDASGVTTVLETEADRALAALSGMRAVVRATTQRHGVRIAKWLGNRAMLVAVDPGTLLRCLDEIWHEAPRHCSLPLHGGMASVEVLILEGDDYVGRAVNVAARLD